MSPVRHNPQKQEQKLIHNNKKDRILIVNGDNPDNYATLKLDLERNGFVVHTFTDPLAALNNFRAGLFNMVVLDKKMSKMNPVYLHKKFKNIDEDVRIYILS
ncbi:MAG: response regulator [Candidatus Nitrosopolaris sp.]